MIGPSHPAREDVLGAISLVDSLIKSPNVQGADALALVVVKRRLVQANDKLRPGTPGTVAAPLVTTDCPVVPLRRATLGLSEVKCL